jgi:putative hydrolase of the HAD superfamily
MVTALYEDVCHNIAANTKRLKTLKEAGMPIVLVANFYGNLKTVIQEFGIDQYFDDVVESEYVKVRKPDPMIFNMGIDALKINQPGIQPNEVCVVGDSDKNDIKPASELGCKTIKIETPTSFRKVLRLVGKAK